MSGMESVRDRATDVLVAHQRHRGGCLCGWAKLGASFARHQVDTLAAAGLLTDRPDVTP